MDPRTMALLPVRTQSSRARSCVMRSLGWRPISRRVSPALRSERILMNGDWPRSTASACFKASSKTGSPRGCGKLREHGGVFLRHDGGFGRAEVEVKPSANQSSENYHGNRNQSLPPDGGSGDRE